MQRTRRRWIWATGVPLKSSYTTFKSCAHEREYGSAKKLHELDKSCRNPRFRKNSAERRNNTDSCELHWTQLKLINNTMERSKCLTVLNIFGSRIDSALRSWCHCATQTWRQYKPSVNRTKLTQVEFFQPGTSSAAIANSTNSSLLQQWPHCALHVTHDQAKLFSQVQPFVGKAKR